LLFGSGMSACTAALDAMMDAGRTLYVPHEHYRKLKDLAGTRWAGYREYSDLSEIDTTLPSLVWVESPSNPHLWVADYERLETFRGRDIRLVADFTLSGLNNYTGPDVFDVEVHSCAKYIGGHNDLMAGVALVKPEWYEPFWDVRSFAGGILDPRSATLLSRSLKTYELRIGRQVENTQEIVAWLNSRVARIYYPRSRFHRHGGAVVSFLGCGDPIELTDRAALLKTIKMAPNFGSVDSLVEVCSTMSHFGKSPEELRASGIEPDLIRLSVGIEPVGQIIADLETLLS
jgi:cystathionine gamma-synthase